MKQWLSGVLLLLILVMAGCKQYDEGPIMSLYSVEKRLEGNWYFDHVIHGGVDSTANYETNQRMEFSYSRKMEGGIFTWYHNYFNPTYINTEIGYWFLRSDKDTLDLIFINTITRDTVKQVKWKINRLAYREVWLERNIKDDLKLEWKLWKWAY